MSNETPNAGLKELRQRLNQMDDDIVRLLAKRLETVGLIAKEKAGSTQAIRDPEREREVLARVETLAQSLGLSAPMARKIFSEIISYSVSRQVASLAGIEGEATEIGVAYQGSSLTYNNLAAEQYVASQGLQGRFVGLPTLKQVIDALASAAVDLAFLPIENTVAGSINQVYDVLREQDLHIVGEESYRVELCLAATADVPASALRRILSHPLALDQCSAFVAALPQARAVPFIDTREAMRAVAEAKDPTLAAVGSPEAAAAHELHILNRNVGNQDEILMRYVALARAPIAVNVRVPCKTSLILSTRHEKGALLRCLHILAEYGLSMTKLESRPRPNRPWEYMFFIDFEGNVAEERAALALEALRSEALYLKILGCYPAKATPADAQTTTLPGAAEVAPVEASPAAPPSGPSTPSQPVARVSKHYRLADRAAHPEDTVIRVGSLLIGGTGFVVIAGPCSVESEDQINRTALYVREQGAHILRGGVFKPRTGPYAFQGLGRDGLDLLAAAGKAAGLPTITEVMTIDQVHPVADKADILQIGARNMQNFPLLSAVGKVDRPVMLKRGLSSTIEEWLAAAEYILAQGNGQVILCERGIRTFESATRNTLDLSAVVVLRERTHLPIVVDPSHGTGKRPYVAPMAWAARACGAHGVSIEVHPDPDKALSDGDQSLNFPEFKALMEGLSRVRV
ncbi:MAG TPA: bifunctional 3-deoxy-7-phosphoheptulonate synthase/chorismate mutase [Polyangia bacterium]|jgi:phospho-2-dehydro-3-deoxyheptonate aldolase|nr:bifunctional 3-deoxy-7-phosphoheptulonate synthase/chorismate mutase [Polyangia bacterium]